MENEPEHHDVEAEQGADVQVEDATDDYYSEADFDDTPISQVRRLNDPSAWLKSFRYTDLAHHLGPLAEHCSWHGALHFADEAIKISVDGLQRMSPGGLCCLYGDVVLPKIKSPVQMIKLWTATSPQSMHFRNEVRQYNN